MLFCCCIDQEHHADTTDTRVITVLRELQQQCKGTLESANGHLRKDGGRRNELAQVAAVDHRDRRESLLDTWRSSQNPQDVIRQLRECRGHAEHWERQFAQWSNEAEHDNGYARSIHDEARVRYIKSFHSASGNTMRHLTRKDFRLSA
jgi:hypothetical protein